MARGSRWSALATSTTPTPTPCSAGRWRSEGHSSRPTWSWPRFTRAWIDRLADHAISYTDAVSFAVMEAARCRTALSFDNDFPLAGFSLWEVEQ